MLGIFDVGTMQYTEPNGSRRGVDIDQLINHLERCEMDIARIYTYLVDSADPCVTQFHHKLSFTRCFVVKPVVPIRMRNLELDNNKDWMVLLDILLAIQSGERDILLMWPHPRWAMMLARVFSAHPNVRFHTLTWKEETLSLEIANLSSSILYWTAIETING